MFLRTVPFFVLALTLAQPASAQSQLSGFSVAASEASLLSAAAVSNLAVISGRAGSDLTIRALNASGEVVSVILRDVVNGSEASVQIAANVASQASLAIGESIQVVAELAGYALVAKGMLIAFIPNEIGRSLLRNSRYEGR